MLLLAENDIRKVVSPERVVEAVAGAMRLGESGDYRMPERMHVEHEGNMLLLMPCFAAGRMATKLVSVFPGNRGKNLPSVMGTVLLNDGRTGEPLAVLNGTALTALRTGAVGAVGVRHTTAPEVHNLGLVGAGAQGLQQVLFASLVRDFRDVYVFDTAEAQVRALIEKAAAQRSGLRFHVATSVENLLEKVEVVVTATTSSRPVLPDEAELLKGRHFIGIGSYRPGMREFPQALFGLLRRVWVDNRAAVHESGDLITPLSERWIDEEQVETLGKWIAGGGSVGAGETTFFKSVGVALFDLLVADLLYREARRQGVGTEVEL